MDKREEIGKILWAYGLKRDEVMQEMAHKLAAYEGSGDEGDVPPDIIIWGMQEMERLRDATVDELLECCSEEEKSIEEEIYEFLDDIGEYAGYSARITKVADEFNLTKEEAESYVWNHASGARN